MRLYFALLVISLYGCKATHTENVTLPDSCLIDLSELEKVTALPEDIVSENRDDLSGWYKYPNGDYLYCLRQVDSKTCGNIVEMQWLTNDVYFVYKSSKIYCMR